MRIVINIARAPKVVRQKATPIGVNAVRAYSMNRKDAPQIRPATVYMAIHGRFGEVLNFAFQELEKPVLARVAFCWRIEFRTKSLLAQIKRKRKTRRAPEEKSLMQAASHLIQFARARGL